MTGSAPAPVPAGGAAGGLPPSVLDDILEWDVASWSRALRFWERRTGDLAGQRVLELGARRGGLSLYFALRGAEVICSDLDGPAPEARALHERHRVAERVRYEALDATAIALPPAGVDVVAFKSVLGGVGSHDAFDRQRRAVSEIHRVLKPGGVLLFAENLRATRLHGWLRRRFTDWGERWRYPTLDEMDRLLAPFARVERETFGFCATLGRSEGQRRALHAVDRLVDPCLGSRHKTIVYGCAWK